MDKASYTRKDLEEMGKRWADRLTSAENREKTWRTDAAKAEAAYLCDADSEHGTLRFNILHSNVETIVPAIYNSTPAPDVRPRHNTSMRDEQGQDPAKAFCDALERGIATQIDDDALTVEIEALAQDSEMAGRGITRLKFDYDEGEEGQPTNERVLFENVSWRNYREGPATRWDGVPWVAYGHEITNAEAERLADDEITEQYGKGDEAPDEDMDGFLWEIWCKETKKVYFLLEDKNRIISVKEDPLGLSDFFPQPMPVQPITGTGKRTPVCPYTVYEKLAGEIDTATKRINAIMSGLKVRGLIAGDAEVVELISGLDDNELSPAPSLEGLAAQGGLQGAVLWWPIDTAIAVLAQLYQQREQSKASVYEMTGISDIVRGASDARETAAAQQIKAQWGSQRVKRKQRMIQSHIRDLFKLTAEVMAKLFSPAGFARAAGMEVTPQMLEMLGRFDEFRIDVETDSTIRADLDRQRTEMSQFLESTGGFFGVMGPLIADKPQMAPAVAEIYASFTRSFQLGKQAEDAVDQMSQMAQQEAAQPKPNPAEEAQKMEAQAQQAELQMKQMELQMKQAEGQVKAQEVQSRVMASQAQMQREQQKMQLDARRAQMDEAMARFDMALKAQQLGLQVDQHQLEMQRAEIDAMLRVEEVDLEREQQRGVQIG